MGQHETLECFVDRIVGVIDELPSMSGHGTPAFLWVDVGHAG
jgi:hypothetical protein